MMRFVAWLKQHFSENPSLILWIVVGLGLRFTLLFSLRYFNLHPSSGPTDGGTVVGMGIKVLLVAPLLESLLFQMLPIEVFKSFPMRDTWKSFLACFFSATLFALMHTYSLAYVVLTFFIGLYLAAMYIVFSSKTENKWAGYRAIVVFHFVYNLITFLVSLLPS